MTRRNAWLGPVALLILTASVHALEGSPVRNESVTAVRKPATSPSDPHYPVFRRPLLPNPLIHLPPGSVKPQGWLQHQLELMRDGQVGRLPELSKWCNPETSAWRSPSGEGEHGWEEMPYWLRGFTALAYVLGDSRLIAEAQSWIDAILESQQADGYFGPRANKEKLDLWPNMLVLNVLQTHYEATNDARVLPFMSRYFKWQAGLEPTSLFPGSWQKIRAGDNLESVLWLYNRTGEPWLLDLARLIHERTVRWDLKVASWHGVNICQGFREPAVFYPLAGDRRYLDAAERNYQTVMTMYGQVPGGMFGADENCREGYSSPRQAAETCSMVEFMRSFEMLLAITGDSIYADRCEEVALNDLPAALAPDHRGMHYLTAPNMIQLDRSDKAPGLQNSGCMLAFSPHRYRCCQHNAGIGWPQFAQHLWMATHDRGLAFVLYAPTSVSAKVGNGVDVRIECPTDYPFDDRIVMSIATPEAVSFPLYLRVPGWCSAPQLEINEVHIDVATAGPGYLRIQRQWDDSDRVTLRLPMDISVTRWRTQGDAVSVRRGPLWYSLRIDERWERSGGSEDWPEFEVFPATPWNYGLILNEKDPATSFEFVRRSASVPEQPFTPEHSPVALQANGKRIPVWTAEPSGLVGELQGSPARSDAMVEQIDLIPMGATRLRIAVFPTIGDGPEANEWTAPPPPRHEASECWDVIYALSDGEIPVSSRDYATPRFTWVPRKGSTEWVTYRFGEPRTVSWCDVYWFDDSGIGYCRPPASWKLYYRDGDAWREVTGASSYGVALDQFNRVTFDAVETSILKLEAQLQPDQSAGILEWRVGD